MRTTPRQHLMFRWLLGIAALLGALRLFPAYALPILVGATVAVLALGVAQDALPTLKPLPRAALLLGCASLGVGGALAWQYAPPLAGAMLLALTLVSATFRRGRLNRTDRVTGLLAAAAFAERGATELSRGLRFGRPCTVAVITFDQLPEIRRCYGRDSATQALRRIADILQTQARTYDLLTRLDGGRFAVMLPETTHDEAVAVLDRVRTAIKELPFIPGERTEPLPLSVTIGLASHPWAGNTIRALIERALAGQGTPAERPVPSPAAPTPPAATSPPQRAFTAPTWAIFAYIGAIWLVTLGFFALTFTPIEPEHWGLFATLAILGIAARQMRITVYGRGAVSNYFAVLIAGGILLGPTAAMLLGLIVALVFWPWRAKPRAFAFDAGTFALLSGILALLAPLLARALPDEGALHLMLLPQGLLLGALCYLLNAGLLVGVMSLSEGVNPLAIWRERFDWFLPYTLAFGVLAVFMALAGTLLGPIGLVIFAIPTFLIRLATKQIIDRTSEHVNTLREAHARLAATNTELARSVETVERSYTATLEAFSNLLNARDSETEGHSQRVVAYAAAVGRAMRLEANEMAALEVGALLHDIGKVAIADAILRKPGPLTEAEWAEMRRHPQIGHEVTSLIPFLYSASPIVRHHHERWDGAGYPDQLRGEDIPLLARIFSVADSFDAMVSDRPYRRGLPLDAALDQLRRGAGTQFDPHIVEVFARLTGDSGWVDAVRTQKTPEQLPRYSASLTA